MYSSAGAEYFAAAGVHIADSLGCVDMLSFGSECGDIDEIKNAATLLTSRSFTEAFELEIIKNKDKSFASIRETVFEKMGGKAEILRSPNNILAIEYCKALIKTNSKIEPITLRRNGDGYNSSEITGEANPSATALRAALKNDTEISAYMPAPVCDIYKSVDGYADIKRLESAIISHLRLVEPDSLDTIAECSGGLGRRICDIAREASDFDTLVSLAATKKYTNARIRRAILYSFMGVHESEIKELPSYTQLLGANTKGREILKRAKNNFNIIVKPAEYKELGEKSLSQIKLTHKADSVYPLFFEKGGPAYRYITSTPKIIM